MKKITIKRLLLISAFFASFIFSALIRAEQTSTHVPIWHKLSLTLEGPHTSELATPNPFTDYRLDATFTSPTNKQYTVPGYYAADANTAQTHATAGNKWQVLFSPNELGKWRYTLSFVKGSNIASVPLNTVTNEQSAGFFDKQTGEFNVIAATKSSSSKDFKSKGKLEYVNKPYLQFNGSKEYFLKAGANSPEVLLGFSGFDATPTKRNYQAHIKHWQNSDPTWQTTNTETDNSSHQSSKGIIGLINYLASLNINAYYFLTMNAYGDGDQVWPWLSKTQTTRYDVSKLAQWDIVFSHMQQKGIMTHFVMSETENESLFEWNESQLKNDFAVSRKIYYRELFARFGYHLATTWNIGEENGWQDPSGDNKQQKANTTKQRKQFADYFQSLTYYPEHIVIHNGPSLDYHIYDKPNDNILGYPAYTGASLQGELKTNTTYNDVSKYRQLTQSNPHPWVITMDEAYIYEYANNVDTWRKSNVWATFMAGGAGIEFYLGGGGDLVEQDLTPYKNYYLAMTNAVAFFQKYVPFTKLTPAPELTKTGWSLSDNSAFYLFYFSNASQAQVTLPNACYTLDWFNPRTNNYINGKRFCINTATSTQLATPPNTPNNDWVYLINLSAK
ncbi:DUF5060 domain-containing protein [Pseudoalteromonas fuliginea]|uniref:DUF5060 domain-containing protein n=1 Tax=Pseudoalteromonas fuliginea TaxID=1872678 RepID=A0ABD3YCH7_9GAMM|nr:MULTISPECIES: DUF5060 domain-containing protein [Pseudoalteromonas]ALQ07918.1 hypothetical protein D172_007515 [Pseudoalteromonas sp. Bsw20308]KDC52321.1 hypothetical protein DC53_05170 [Pseudoalteromonas fuliginea]KJZ27167.1 hypothetical protein TW82_13615 [Pseudoalteromonas fuliginea]